MPISDFFRAGASFTPSPVWKGTQWLVYAHLPPPHTHTSLTTPQPPWSKGNEWNRGPLGRDIGNFSFLQGGITKHTPPGKRKIAKWVEETSEGSGTKRTSKFICIIIIIIFFTKPNKTKTTHVAVKIQYLYPHREISSRTGADCKMMETVICHLQRSQTCKKTKYCLQIQSYHSHGSFLNFYWTPNIEFRRVVPSGRGGEEGRRKGVYL